MRVQRAGYVHLANMEQDQATQDQATQDQARQDKQDPDVQDRFLEALREQRVPVSIFLRNGIKLQGTIENSDRFVITLKNVITQAIFKHAISTVMPSRPVRLPTAADGENPPSDAPSSAD